MYYSFRSIDVQVTCGSDSTTQTMTPQKTTFYITSTQLSSSEIEMTVSSTHQDNSTTVSDTVLMKSTEPSEDEMTCKLNNNYMCYKRQRPSILIIVESVLIKPTSGRNGMIQKFVNTLFSKLCINNVICNHQNLHVDHCSKE